MDILHIFCVLIVSSLLGSMLFFSFVLAPLIFIKLSPEIAGKFIRSLFPWYYFVIIICAFSGALALLFKNTVCAFILLMIAFSALFLRQFLLPQINKQRDRMIEGEERAKKVFNHLHRLSVAVNFLQILGTIWVLIDLV